jgi:hypothetical protein
MSHYAFIIPPLITACQYLFTKIIEKIFKFSLHQAEAEETEKEFPGFCLFLV